MKEGKDDDTCDVVSNQIHILLVIYTCFADVIAGVAKCLLSLVRFVHFTQRGEYSLKLVRNEIVFSSEQPTPNSYSLQEDIQA
jgi:hypothetical protein